MYSNFKNGISYLPCGMSYLPCVSSQNRWTPMSMVRDPAKPTWAFLPQKVMVELPISSIKYDQMTWARKKETNSSAAPNKKDRNYTSKGSLKTSRFFPANFKAYKSCQGGVTPIEAHSRHPFRWNVAHPETPIHPGLAVLDINAVTDSEGGTGWRQGIGEKDHGSCPIVSRKKPFHEGHNYHGDIFAILRPMMDFYPSRWIRRFFWWKIWGGTKNGRAFYVWWKAWIQKVLTIEVISCKVGSIKPWASYFRKSMPS